MKTRFGLRRDGTLLAGMVLVLYCVVAGRSELAAQEVQTTLIAVGDEWSFFKGIEEPDRDWFLPTFDDGFWERGASPFGYGDTGGRGTVLNDMQNSYWSVYIRRIFDVEDVSTIKMMILRINYDDGIVAYLNGEEVARLSMPGNPGDPVPFDTQGTSHEQGSFQSVLLGCEQLELLGAGENVFAIQGHNTTLDSSDLVIEPELLAVTTVCPTAMTCEERTNGDIRVRWTRPVSAMRYDFLELRRNGVLVDPQPRITSSLYTDGEPLPGKNTYHLKVGLCGSECEMECSITIGGAVFRRGDVDDTASVNINDAIVILASLFQGAGLPPCPDAADTNDDGSINLADAVFLLASLFQGMTQPPDPGTMICGPDPTDDNYPECTYAADCGA